MSLSTPILSVLSHFRSVFTRPTWEKAQVLVTGTILARGRRTVTAALRATGHEHDTHFSRFHAVFSRARWSALELARRLLLLLVQAFAPQGALTLVIDETLERRRGPTISERSYHRDPIASSKSQLVVASGLRWMVLALVVNVPWSGGAGPRSPNEPTIATRLPPARVNSSSRAACAGWSWRWSFMSPGAGTAGPCPS